MSLNTPERGSIERYADDLRTDPESPAATFNDDLYWRTYGNIHERQRLDASAADVGSILSTSAGLQELKTLIPPDNHPGNSTQQGEQQ